MSTSSTIAAHTIGCSSGLGGNRTMAVRPDATPTAAYEERYDTYDQDEYQERYDVICGIAKEEQCDHDDEQHAMSSRELQGEHTPETEEYPG